MWAHMWCDQRTHKPTRKNSPLHTRFLYGHVRKEGWWGSLVQFEIWALMRPRDRTICRQVRAARELRLNSGGAWGFHMAQSPCSGLVAPQRADSGCHTHLPSGHCSETQSPFMTGSGAPVWWQPYLGAHCPLYLEHLSHSWPLLISLISTPTPGLARLLSLCPTAVTSANTHYSTEHTRLNQFICFHWASVPQGSGTSLAEYILSCKFLPSWRPPANNTNAETQGSR